MVRGGSSKYVLVIGVEKLSDLTDVNDRGTAFIFADGAGAAVVGPSEKPAIGPVVWGSDGEQSGLITQSEPWDRAMAADPPQWPVMKMDGNPVFKWAAFTMAKAAAETLERAGVTADEIEVFVPHQANMRITDAMLRALKLPESVVVGRDIEWHGNTSAASIPLAIDTLLTSGEARSGQTCLVIGFGAGLVYAGQVIVLP
jgi:3-oxoacyl-[acyl-carrier-protein] synthase-3